MVQPISGIFEQDVLKLCRVLFDELAHGAASLDIEPSNDPAGGESIVITPSSSKSATIRIHVSDRTAYIMLGRGIRAEVFASYRNEIKALERVRQILEAVISGNFSEDIWYAGAKVAKSVGVLSLSGRSYKLRYRAILNLFSRKKRMHYEYLPYSAQ